jgi:hypothetical protein
MTATKTTKTNAERLNAAVAQKIDGAQAIYTGRNDPNHGPGWFLRFPSGRTQWIGRSAAAAAEWIANR